MSHAKRPVFSPVVRIGLLVLGLFLSPDRPLAAQTQTVPPPSGPTLFTPSSRAAADLATDATTMRARFVRVAADQLAAADGRDAAPRIVLNLFDDVTLAATLDRVEPSRNGYVWVGRIPDVALSTVTLASARGVIYGSVLTPAATYIVRHAGNGDYLVTQIDQNALPPEAPPLTIPTSGQDAAQAAIPDGPMADSASTIDVMVLYTPAAAAAASGGIEALVNAAISTTNTTYANSGVTQRVRLVFSGQVAYTESGDNGVDLGNLAAGAGALSGVAALRDTSRADLVSLLTNTTNSPYCGVAYKLQSISTTFAPYGYSVVEQSCAVGNLSFPHELGHNMGAGHDWYVDNGVTPQTYAHGYVNPNVGQRWRTVMSYNNLCSAQGFFCGRIAYWAHPGLTYLGTAMGVPGGTNAGGSCAFNLANPACDADDHRTLNETAVAVANFRQSATLSVTSLMPNVGLPAQAGTPITWTATGNGGTAPYTWKFHVFNGVSWQVGQDWSSSNTWTWTPTTPGAYNIQVWARNAGSSAQYDAWTYATATITVPTLRITDIFSPAIPPVAGTPSSWYVNTFGGTPPHAYKWWLFDGSAWTVVKDWTLATNGMTWTPPAAGTYDLQVWVRNAGSSAAYDAWAPMPRVTVAVPATLTPTTLTPSVASGAPARTPITWTAQVLGGAAPYTYKFYVFDGATWTVGQDWSAARTWTWIPPTAGTYAVQVWVRNAGSAAVYDAWLGVPSYTVTAPAALTPTSFTSDRGGSVPAGTPVTWSANAIGGTGPYTWRFYVFNGSSWSIGRDWGASNTWTWTPSSPGTYSFQVWLRNAGSAATYDAWTAAGPMTVTAPTTLVATSLVSSPGAPLVTGGPATLQATASGGTGPYTWKFWVFNGTSWSVGQDWSASRTWTWTPPAAGTYHFQVWVRNAGSAASYDAWTGLGPVSVHP